MGTGQRSPILTLWKKRSKRENYSKRISLVSTQINWSGCHHRLHRRLLQNPKLLPDGITLLLAVSGGQDSMAMLGLLRQLQHSHGWTLQLWHGDHSWHTGSTKVAHELANWCKQEGLSLRISRAASGQAMTEASARAWRYSQLLAAATELHSDVVTAHTATDRAEGVLLNMARGCGLHGLSALNADRALSSQHPDGPRFRRPFLDLTRSETAGICRSLNLPVWVDPSNQDLHLARNRIRHQVMPVLDELHPGSDRRIAELSDRVFYVRETQIQLSQLALEALQHERGLNRKRMRQLEAHTCRALMLTWLRECGAPSVDSESLHILSHLLRKGDTKGQYDLGGQWWIRWNEGTIQLINATSIKSPVSPHITSIKP